MQNIVLTNGFEDTEFSNNLKDGGTSGTPLYLVDCAHVLKHQVIIWSDSDDF